MTKALELGELANFTSVNVAGNTVSLNTTLTNDSSTVGGNTALTLRTYSDDKAANAYANAVSDANTTSYYQAANAYANAVSYADTRVANLVNSAPAALDTLLELAGALGNDASFSTTVMTGIGNAYTNATNYASNADNIASGTLATARLPATANVSTAINVGANVSVSVNTISIGNSTVNSYLTSNQISTKGNMSIGTTATNAKLYVVGSANNYLANGIVCIRDELANTTNYTFAGITFASSPDLDWTVGKYAALGLSSFQIRDQNSITRLHINANTGFIGLGTTTPSTKLHVFGTTYAAANLAEIYSSINCVRVQPRSDGNHSLFLGNYVSGAMDISAASSNTSSANISLQGYGGSVALGHFSPVSRLDIFSASDYGHLTLRSNTGNVGIRFDVEDPGTTYRNWQLDAQGIAGDAMTFTPSTSGGGTSFSNPAFKVIASGTTGYVRVGNNTAYSNWDRNSITGNASEDFYVQTGEASREIHLRPGSAQNAVKITANNSIVFEGVKDGTLTNARNEICIGTLPSWGTSGKAFFTSVAEYGNSNSGLILACGYDDGGDVGGIKITDDGVVLWGAGDEDLFRIYNEDGGTLVFQINDAGNCFLNGAAVTSDVRIKSDITTIENALQKTLQLRGVNYSTTNDKTGEKDYNIGLIAQEAQLVIPNVVKEGRNELLHITYGNIVGLLVEAIKEQQSMIEDLKERMDQAGL